MRQPLDRRSLLAGAGTLAAAAVLPAGRASARRRLVLNDASGLSATPVASHWAPAAPLAEADFIRTLREELKLAREERRPVAVGAARHSMGGQSLPLNGRAMTFDLPRVEPDRANRVFRAHAGTRWHQVIAALDPLGFSPAVMQSNSDFGVGATFAVNAHGWPTPYGPFGATVRACRMMLADGEIVTCSRMENADLFRLAMGGYGLAGILLDLDVEMVDNGMMRPRFERMPAEDFAARFTGTINGPSDTRMIYGRLSVNRRSFFREALLVSFRPAPAPAGGIPPAGRGGGVMGGLSREIYRAQIGSEAGKTARWAAETVVGPRTAGAASRNALMNEPAANLENRDQRRVDILHEYFVHPSRFVEFLGICRDVIPAARAEFLNITLRWVRSDSESLLSYAPTDRIAAVMSFSQERTAEGEADMIRTTEALIDGVAGIGGSFYLPYRTHARLDQFRAVYPQAARFADEKRRVDPGLVFRNGLWNAYFAG
jgi:FAD/FMN-containing dehydrogenase